MLSKNRRISKVEFPYIISKGKRFNSPHILLYIAELHQKMAQHSRFAFSVSKKVLTQAVSRNKLRRQGYAIIEAKIDTIQPGFFFFFSFKKGSGKLAFSAIEKEIFELLSEAHMVS